jgi:hypothetical protein
MDHLFIHTMNQIYDESNNTLKKIFECDRSCKEFSLLSYAHTVGDDTGVNVYRDFINKGQVYSARIAFIPKENNEWQLGRNCRGAEPCVDGSEWVTDLDENNIVLRFDKGRNNPSAIETKYVHVSTQ